LAPSWLAIVQRERSPDRRNRREQSSACAAVEIRSYRRVFALERRLYRIDGLKLNPAGVPLRGIGYLLGLLAAALLASRLPLVAGLVGIVPWYLRDAIAPALGAFVLTAIRVEGRPFHLTALGLLRYALGARHYGRLRPCLSPGSRWRAGELLVLDHRGGLRPRS
jgi:hypothetical protein